MKKDLSQLRIMLVEDQDEVRRLMKDVLVRAHVRQVYEHQSAETALKFISRSYDFVDVVLCDWKLDGEMTGLDLLQKVRKANIDVFFLMISGLNDAKAIQRAKEQGVDGYILKPFSPEQIEVKLRILLSQKVVA